MADQIALRVAESQVSAGSAVAVTADFRTRSSATASTPTSVRYRVDCLTTGRQIINWTEVSPASSVTITVPGTSNEIVDSSNSTETRQIHVIADYGLSTQIAAAKEWRVRNILNFPSPVVFEHDLRLEAYHPITAAEIAAGLEESDLDTGELPGDIRRYGFTATAGVYTVQIPTDFATLQAAVDLIFLKPVEGATITLNIASGHALTKGLLVQNGDFSHFTITSTDATVTLDAGFDPVDDVQSVAMYNGGIIVGINAKMPKLGCLIDADHAHGPGYHVMRNSVGYVNSACGVINSGKHGLLIFEESSCYAALANFSGAAYGNRVTTNSTLNANSANFSGTTSATDGSGGATANLDVSRGSLVNIMGSASAITNLSGSACRGLAARRSRVSAVYCNFNDCATEGVRAESNSQIAAGESTADGCDIGFLAGEASTVSAENSTADDCTTYGYFAQDGSVINAGSGSAVDSGLGAFAREGATISATNMDASGSSGQGFYAETGGRVIVPGGVASGRAVGVLANTGGEVVFSSGTATSCTQYGIQADGGRVWAPGANVSGATTSGIRAQDGSYVDATGANAQKGGSPDTTDIVCLTGSTIAALSATGGVSKTANTVDSAGVIYN